MDNTQANLNNSSDRLKNNYQFTDAVKSQNYVVFNSKQEILDVIYSFSSDVVKNFGDFVKSIVVFGSVVKKSDLQDIHDIDILIIIDDTAVSVDYEFIRNYNTTLTSFANKYKNLHITSTRLTRFWQLAINADPVITNIIREGFIVFDSKFVEMFKHLLFDGFIKPSPESVFIQLNRSRLGMDKIKNKRISILIDLYWALIDSVQALIMYEGKLAPAPEKISEVLGDLYHENKGFILSKKEIQFIDEIYDITKRVMRRQRKSVEFFELNDFFDKAKEIIEKIEKYISE